MITLKDRLLKRITKSEDLVFLRKEFNKMGGYDQVGRALLQLVNEGVLVKSGYGVYTKAERSIYTDKPIPSATLSEIGFIFLKKSRIKAALGRAALLYAQGETTQMPVGAIIDIGRARVTRKIKVGSKILAYERSKA